MEDCGHVLVMEDGAPCHMGVASLRRNQLIEDGWEGWGPRTWPLSRTRHKEQDMTMLLARELIPAVTANILMP